MTDSTATHIPHHLLVYLWRTVDCKGEIPGSYITKMRDKFAALVFLKKT